MVLSTKRGLTTEALPYPLWLSLETTPQVCTATADYFSLHSLYPLFFSHFFLGDERPVVVMHNNNNGYNNGGNNNTNKNGYA